MELNFIVLSILIFFFVFGLAASCKQDKIASNFSNLKAVGTGISIQFILMPFLGFLSVSIFKGLLPMEQQIMLLLATTSPGGTKSNFWIAMFNADLGLSLALTTASSIVCLFFIPFNLFMYTSVIYRGESIAVESIDWGSLVLTVVIITLGVFLGHFLVYRIRDKSYAGTVQFLAHKIGNICGIIAIIYALHYDNKSNSGSFYAQPAVFYIAILFPIITVVSCAVLITSSIQLPKPECVTITVESCMQNVAIGLNVSFAMYANDEEALSNALSVLIFYALAQALFSVNYCIISWKIGWTKAPKDDPFCKVITHNYELEDNSPQIEIEAEISSKLT